MKRDCALHDRQCKSCADTRSLGSLSQAVHVAARTPVTRMLRPLYHYDFFWLRSTEGVKIENGLPFCKSYGVSAGKEDLKAIRVLHATTEKVVKQVIIVVLALLIAPLSHTHTPASLDSPYNHDSGAKN